MTRLLNALLICVIFLALAVASGRAYDYEVSAGEPSGVATHSAAQAAAVERPHGAPVSQAAALTAEPASLAGKARSLAAIRQVFGRRAPAAIRVAGCETGFTWNERAVGRAGERGIFQLHPVHRGWIDRLYGWARIFEPLQNARAAYRLSRGGTDWRAWSCRP